MAEFSSGLYAVNNSKVLEIAESTFTATDRHDAADYYLTEAGILYTGSRTNVGDTYTIAETSIPYTGDMHQYLGQWFGDVTVGTEIVVLTGGSETPMIGGVGTATRCTFTSNSSNSVVHSPYYSCKMTDGSNQSDFSYRYSGNIDAVLTNGTLYRGTV